MASRLRIFVSAGPDLELEREIIGNAIASLPVSLGWVIKYTPARDEPLAPALKQVVASHFYVFLLGSDIRAPLGSELYMARRSRKRVVGFLKEAPRTPAALVFIREAALDWKRFRDEDELGPLLQSALVEQLLERPETYALSPVDWETLSAMLGELKGEEGLKREREEVASGYRGAGGDAVIVAPGSDLPPGGVLVEGPKSKS